MYQALLSSLVFVAAMGVLHVVVKRVRSWSQVRQARKDERAREVAAWYAQEQAEFRKTDEK